jgi:hypothetical protein
MSEQPERAKRMRERRYVGIYAILAGLAISANLPGRVNPDSVEMLWQARAPASLSDWHSPFVTFAFGLLAPIFGSPTGALVLQVLLLMTWPALLFERALVTQSPTVIKTALVVGLCCLCAVFVALAGQVNKDVFQLSLLSLVFFLLGRQLDGFAFAPSEGESMASFFALLGVAFVRPVNFIVLAACALVAWALIAKGALVINGLGKRRVGLSLVLACLVFTAAPLGSRWIFAANASTPQDFTILFDLAGISVESKTNVFTQLAPEEPPLEPKPEDCYTPHQSDPFLFGACKGYEGLLNRHRDKVYPTWLGAIAGHPWAYVVHRAAFMKALLGARNRANRMVVPSPPYDLATNAPAFIGDMPESKTAGLDLWRPTVAYTPFGRAADFAFRKWPGRPSLWLAVLVLAAVGSWFLPKARRPVPLLLATLGSGNVAMIGFLSGGDDLRYLLPTWFCAVASIVFYVAVFVERLPPVAHDGTSQQISRP